MTDKRIDCGSVNRSMLVPVGLLHDYADMLETTGRDASTVRSVADSLAQTECRSVSQALAEDAWAVATWLEARLDEEGVYLEDDEEYQACRRLIEAFSPDPKNTEQESVSEGGEP